MSMSFGRKASNPPIPPRTSERFWATTEEVLTVPLWYSNRPGMYSTHEGETVYSLPFVGLTIDYGLPSPVLPLGAVPLDPAMGRLIMASARGDAIDLGRAIGGSHLTQAEDWMLYCSSPAIPWTIAPNASAMIDEGRAGSVVVAATCPRAAVVASLTHYASCSRYRIASQLALVIGSSRDPEMAFDISVARRCKLSDYPLSEIRGKTGFATLTLVGRDYVT